jgi:multiple sugar transport system permease protein
VLRPLWQKHLESTAARERLGLPVGRPFLIDDYNRLAGSAYQHLSQIPFPLPEDAPAGLRDEWLRFVRDEYPRRLVRIRVTPELQAAYQERTRQLCRTIDAYNRLTGSALTGFEQIALPEREDSDRWRSFVAEVPLANLVLESPEVAWQECLRARYGSVAAVNAAYGWSLARFEEAHLPMAEAIAVTFFNHEWSHYFWDVAGNYVTVFDYLFRRGRAFVNTVILISLTILATLTVNPLAAYALSRFRFRQGEQILLFLLATMAFPAAVSAIPAFLLMRDLHLLNTFSVLVLPGLANGLSIFILKGFFDGLPRELYEAAAIDGAKEWQILLNITLPMTTPILAVNTLNAFIQAYNSWEWALLVCQRSDYWTLAVWLYQFTRMSQLEQAPFVIMAAFVVASVPTALVFIVCQKVILRGIVIPSMK